ncbi:ABC transporter permease [Alteromonas aestuariivivens]|uniref:ABC transporter permease n=1 Tax=Alteromonas aestuariivivens TaxID=1938339 RepID=A0A3D8M9K3_9ALTE|nr:ABC transporter permease [Alteromonas aestuariivivens]RDV25990.1 ABC transporter permease [Alteromonas aestuariivivens]
MFSYYLRLALQSLRRNPYLSSLMTLAIALGIGASMTTLTINYLMSSDPIPHKSKQLYYVQLDNWSPYSAAREPNDPPDQLTWRDATQLMSAAKAYRQSAMASSGAVIESGNPDIKPFLASLRLNFADFFPMFDAPFLYGNGWTSNDDDKRVPVIVLSKPINDRLFGGENSVGRYVTIENTQFRVTGVLDNWVLVPRFYDVTTDAFQSVEDVFIPFYFKQTLQLSNGGNTNCWKSPEGEGFEAFLQSECVNFQMWVELPTPADREEYFNYLNAYAEEQKALGRFPRPINNRLSDVMQWMENEKVVADDAQIMMWLAFLFLLVCLLNTVGLLLSKFSTRTSDIALRRAIGASRQAIFTQYILESALVGVLGGLFGLILANVGLIGIRSLYGDFISELATLDFTMISVAILLSILVSILAGSYPAWRACSVPPASQLKNQ